MTAAECMTNGFLGALALYIGFRISAWIWERRERRETPLGTDPSVLPQPAGNSKPIPRWIHEGESNDYWMRIWTSDYMIMVEKLLVDEQVAGQPIKVVAYNGVGKTLASEYAVTIGEARKQAELWMHELFEGRELS